MKREKIKTLLLVFLFVISIFLTQQLWIEFPYEILPSFGEKQDSSKPEYFISEIISPEKYIVSFSENRRTLFHSDEDHNLWDKGKAVIRQVLQNDDVSLLQISSDEFEQEKKRKSIIYKLPINMHTYALAKGLDIKISQTIYGAINKVDDIYIYLGREPYIILSNSFGHFKVSKPGVDVSELRETVDSIEQKGYTRYYSMEESIGSSNGILIPLTMGAEMPYVHVDSEAAINNDKIIDTMAADILGRDIGYIRKIVENNGSVIYMDNQKTLKFYENGLLEYFNTVDEIVAKRNPYVSLDTAIDFLFKFDKWRENLYLSNIKEIESEGNKGYKIVFKHKILGFPVVGMNGETTNLVEIEVFNNHIKSYRRYIRNNSKITIDTSKKGKTMFSSYDILNKNFNVIQETYIKDMNIDILATGKNEKMREEILNSIDDIYLAYYDPVLKILGERLTPAWVIKIDNRFYIFDAYTGYMTYGGNWAKN